MYIVVCGRVSIYPDKHRSFICCFAHFVSLPPQGPYHLYEKCYSVLLLETSIWQVSRRQKCILCNIVIFWWVCIAGWEEYRALLSALFACGRMRVHVCAFLYVVGIRFSYNFFFAGPAELVEVDLRDNPFVDSGLKQVVNTCDWSQISDYLRNSMYFYFRDASLTHEWSIWSLVYWPIRCEVRLISQYNMKYGLLVNMKNGFLVSVWNIVIARSASFVPRSRPSICSAGDLLLNVDIWPLVVKLQLHKCISLNVSCSCSVLYERLQLCVLGHDDMYGSVSQSGDEKAHARMSR